jgi:hypothetical protein
LILKNATCLAAHIASVVTGIISRGSENHWLLNSGLYMYVSTHPDKPLLITSMHYRVSALELNFKRAAAGK